MESLPKILARNARALRDHRQMSEPDLVKAGVAAGSVNRVMHGQNVTLNVLAEVARGLRVPAWVLLHPTLQPGEIPAMATEADIEAEVERRVKERISDVLMEAWKLNVDPEKPDPTDALLLSLSLMARLRKESRETVARMNQQPRQSAKPGKSKRRRPPTGGTQ